MFTTLAIVANLTLTNVPTMEGMSKHYSTVKSTCYGYKGDKWAGGNTIWWQTHPSKVEGVAMRRPLTSAERKAGKVEPYGSPLGRWVVVENPRNGKSLVLRVGDRGPFWWVPEGGKGRVRTTKPYKSEKGRFASNLDITWPACQKLKHRGLQYVRLYRIKPGSPLDRYLNRLYGCNPKHPPKWWRKRKCQL